jgi:hypothetical protein
MNQEEANMEAKGTIMEHLLKTASEFGLAFCEYRV